ncbi:uncharacterized protein rab44 isoform X1 [Oryzias latipes]|uniref:RAB44, member RAS oncogene family n=1 Tax=Oryzias latipes TaxID=8090 RepID=A0A3B3HA22_ORYLA
MSAQSNKKKRLGSRRAPAHQSKLLCTLENVTDEPSADQQQAPDVQEVLVSADHVRDSGGSLSRRKLGSSRKKTERLQLEPKEDDDEEASLDATPESHISAAASAVPSNQRGENETSATPDGSYATSASEYMEAEVSWTPSPEIPCAYNPHACRNETALRPAETFDSLQSGGAKSEVTPRIASACSEGFQDDYSMAELPVTLSVITTASSCREASESRARMEVLDSSKGGFTTNETQSHLLLAPQTAQFPQVGVIENPEKDESKHVLLNETAFPSDEEHVDETVDTSKSLLGVQTTDKEEVSAPEDDQNVGFMSGKSSDGLQDDGRKCPPITGGQESAAGQMYGGFDELDQQPSDGPKVHQEEQGVPSEVELRSFSVQSRGSESSPPFKSCSHSGSVSSDGDASLSGITKHPGSRHEKKEKPLQESAVCASESSKSENTLQVLLKTESASLKEDREDPTHDLILSVSQDSPPRSGLADGRSEDPDVWLPSQEPDQENFSLLREKEAQNEVDGADEHSQQKGDNSDVNPRPHYGASDEETVANEAISRNEICLKSSIPGRKTSSTEEDTASYEDRPAACPEKPCEALDTRDEDQEFFDTKKRGLSDGNQADLAPRQENRSEDERKSTSEQKCLPGMEDKSALSSFQSQSSVSSEAHPQAGAVCLVDKSSAGFDQNQSTAGQEKPGETELEERGRDDTAKTQNLNAQAGFGRILVSKKEEEIINEWCYREKQKEEAPTVPLVTLSERQECMTAVGQSDIVQHLIECEPNVSLSVEERLAEQSCKTKGRLTIRDEGPTAEQQIAHVGATRHSENAGNTKQGPEAESAPMQGISHSDGAQSPPLFSRTQSPFPEAHQSKLTVDYDKSQVREKKGLDSALEDIQEMQVQEETAPNPSTRESAHSSETEASHFNHDAWLNSASLNDEGNTEVSSLSFEQPERIKQMDSVHTESMPDLDFIPSTSSTELPEKKDRDSDVEMMMSYGNLPSNQVPSQNTAYICSAESPPESMAPKHQTSSSLLETFTANNEPHGAFSLLNPAGSLQVLSEAHKEQINLTQEVHPTDDNSIFQKEYFPPRDSDCALKSQHVDCRFSKDESPSSRKAAGHRRKFGSSRRDKEKRHNKADEESQESKEEEVQLTGRHEATEIQRMSQGEPEDVLFVAEVRKINSAGPADKTQEGKRAFLNNALVDSTVATADKEDSSKSNKDKHVGCGKEPENSAQLTGYDSLKKEKIQSSQASVWSSHPDTQSHKYHDDVISSESAPVPDQKEAFVHRITLSADKDSHRQEVHQEEDRSLLTAVAEDTKQDVPVEDQVKTPPMLEDSAPQPEAVLSQKADFTTSELPETSTSGSTSTGQPPATDPVSSVSFDEMTQKNDNGRVDVQIPEVTVADEEEPGSKKEGMQGKHPETKGASPDLNASKKKRKMGSTRRSLGSQARKEKSDERKEPEDEETSTLHMDEDKQTELVPTFKEKQPQFHTEHGDGSSEPRKEELFEAVERSHGDESILAPEGRPLSENQPVNRSQGLLAPQPPLTAFPNNNAVSEAASGARRKKFGSNRKSHLHQNKKEPEVSVGVPVEDTAQPAEEQEQQGTSLDSDSQVGRQQHKEVFPHISSTTAGSNTLAQSQQTPVRQDQDHRKQRVVGDPRASGLTADSYNVVLIGDSSVGKTSFMKRAQNGKFFSEVQASIGLDSCEWTVVVDGKRVVMCLWDTAGQERFRSMTRQIFHKAHAFLLMYDITSCQSFSAVSYWANCIQEAASENVTVVLVGNKSDHTQRQVKSQQGEILAKEYNFEFVECSAATGENVLEALETVGRLLSHRADLREETTKLPRDPVKKKRSGCC